MLTHAPRQLPSWLIFDVRQKMKVVATLAIALVLLSACASQRRFLGGGVYGDKIPRVTVSVTRYDGELDFAPIPKTPLALVIYPFGLQRAGIAGEVFATVVVEADGRVSDVIVDRASQHEFGAAAAQGLRRTPFFPAKKDGVAVRCTAQCRVAFTFDDE